METVIYCIAYILFWLELHVSRTCGQKICQFVRKLSKGSVNGQFVPVPLSGHEAVTQKNRQQCLTWANKFSPIANNWRAEQFTLFLTGQLTGGSPDVVIKTREYFRQKV